MKQLTASLIGAPLDYWVAKALGKEAYISGNYCFLNAAHRDWRTNPNGNFSPSTNWEHGGPIIEQLIRKGAEIRLNRYNNEYRATFQNVKVFMRGGTVLIASMRLFVYDTIGEYVDQL